MKATIVITAITLALVASAQAQNNNENLRSGRPGTERQFRGQGSPQFRGGDRDLEDPRGFGPRMGRQGASDDADFVRPGRGSGVCPNCGAPQQQRQRQGYRQGQPGQQGGQGLGPQGGGRGFGPGPRLNDPVDGAGAAPGPRGRQWGQGQGPGPQGQPDFAPRGRGMGRPSWDGETDRPVGPRGVDRD